MSTNSNSGDFNSRYETALSQLIENVILISLVENNGLEKTESSCLPSEANKIESAVITLENYLSNNITESNYNIINEYNDKTNKILKEVEEKKVVIKKRFETLKGMARWAKNHKKTAAIIGLGAAGLGFAVGYARWRNKFQENIGACYKLSRPHREKCQLYAYEESLKWARTIRNKCGTEECQSKFDKLIADIGENIVELKSKNMNESVAMAGAGVVGGISGILGHDIGANIANLKNRYNVSVCDNLSSDYKWLCRYTVLTRLSRQLAVLKKDCKKSRYPDICMDAINNAISNAKKQAEEAKLKIQ